MAYFIVIGTNNDVKDVVDEIKHAHLQHNIITSGCIHSEGEDKYYHWDVFNEQGHKTKENNEPIALHDALTNQIAHFKTLLQDNVIPNVFILSKCFDAEESDTLHMVYEELCQIGGATLCGIQVDIVLIGYDLKKPDAAYHLLHRHCLNGLCTPAAHCLPSARLQPPSSPLPLTDLHSQSFLPILIYNLPVPSQTS